MLRQFSSMNSDGTFPTGTFCLLTHKEYNQNDQTMFMIDSHHGLVIQLYERNMYDDSDFFAVVWNEEKQKPEHIQYATTRGWTYPCHAVVDASEEIVAQYQTYCKEKTDRWNEYHKKVQAYIPAIGKKVRSLTTRGKAKNAEGYITWVGKSSFSSGLAVRFRTDQGNVVFVEVDRIQIWNNDKEEWTDPATYSYSLQVWTVNSSIIPFPE